MIDQELLEVLRGFITFKLVQDINLMFLLQITMVFVHLTAM